MKAGSGLGEAARSRPLQRLSCRPRLACPRFSRELPVAVRY